ncbi:deoxycytidylate deaminase [Exaiptasia diaphana]|uniref:dCMP deaminase n=1 Tax=Exaiptasia diaphana TaxID=2652724 RepID=A0A913XLJ6_EXADI|nr:deoxycytidylate deaminase [Exaiptasia diaphana]KXJ10990.1 Deoxycytidylate deaminase [Exaiptasia diaphana]
MTTPPPNLKKSFYQNILKNGSLSEQNDSIKRKSDTEDGITKKQKVSKRTDYLSWDEYFMAVAFLSAQRSKDPSSQVGACIVNADKKIVGIGYNGMPNGCSDDLLPWNREANDELDTKYPYVCHAEMNAILNKNSAEVKGASIYVALFPCNECSKIIIQSGVKEVVYASDKYHTKPSMIASRRLLDMAGVKHRQYTPPKSQIVVDFTAIDGKKK